MIISAPPSAWLRAGLVCSLLFAWPTAARGDVVRDGSIGPSADVQPLGPEYVVGPEFGAQRGSNLFHSFSELRFTDPQSLRFSLDPGNEVAHIFARVTGGEPAFVGGRLSAPADLYVLSPAGLIFGPSGTLDVNGAFRATTAQRLRFDDETVFEGRSLPAVTLSFGSPAAYGFDAGPIAPIRVDLAALAGAPHQHLALVGGNILIEGPADTPGDIRGFVASLGGRLDLISVQSEGELALGTGAPDTSLFAELGEIRLENALVASSRRDPRLLFSDADGAGDLFVRARDLRLRDSSLESITGLNRDAGDIDVAIRGTLRIERGDVPFKTGIFAETGFEQFGGVRSGSGDGGDIRIHAGSVEILGGGAIGATSRSLFGGDRGSIEVTAEDWIRIAGLRDAENRSALITNYDGRGALSDSDRTSILVRAPRLVLEESGTLLAETQESADAGNIRVEVDHLEMSGNARIDTSTRGPGDAGNILILAEDSVSMTGRSDALEFTGITSLSGADPLRETTGSAGTIEIETPGLYLREGAAISVETLKSGDGGQINLDAAYLDLYRSSISARSEGTGDAGSIEIDPNEVLTLRESAISTQSARTGGGDVTITSRLRVDLQNASITTEVGPDAPPDVRGGNIVIDPQFVILRDGVLRTDGPGGGDIDVTADFVLLSPRSSISAEGSVTTDGTIDVPAPDVDLVASLAALPESEIAVELPDRCGVRRDPRGGSFSVRSADGLPVTPELPGFQLPGVPSFESGHRQDAIAHWQAAARNPASAPERVTAAELELARIHAESGSRSLALAALERALETASDAQHAQIVALRAHVYWLNGEPEAALTLSAVGPPEARALLLREQAHALVQLQRLNQAKRTYAMASTLSQDSTVRLLLDVDQSFLEDDSAAVVRLERAETELGPSSLVSRRARLRIGLRYAELAGGATGRRAAALRLVAARHWIAAAEASRAAGDVHTETWAWGSLAGLYASQELRSEAHEVLIRAIDAARVARDLVALSRWYRDRARLEADGLYWDRALDDYRQAYAALSVLQRQVAGSAQARAAFVDRYSPRSFAIELVDQLLKHTAAEENADTRASLLSEARDRLEDLKVTELEDYLDDACLSARRTQPPDSIAGAVVVYPVSLPDRTELIVSSPDGLERFEVPVTAQVLRSEANTLRRLLEKRTTRQYLRPAARLFDWLVRPLLGSIAETDTLIFVTDGALRSIPMSVLFDVETERHLIEITAVANVPGLSLVAPRALVREPLRALSAGISDSIQGFPALPHVGDELRSIDRFLQTDSLLNQEFVTARLEQAIEGRAFDVVHIASHGEFGSRLEEAYLLTYDGRLGMGALADIVAPTQVRDRPIELLTLSACRTAAGDERAALGLAGVAVRAGARSTLASLWSVNDAATQILVQDFYEQLAAPGVSRAQALQHAQQALLERPELRHPYYWGAFLMIGSWL